MVGAYQTKRLAPPGYMAVTRPLAQQLYDREVPVTLCGNNVTSFHVFGGWCLGRTVQKNQMEGRQFENIVNGFLFYLEPELGRYVVFYVRKDSL